MQFAYFAEMVAVNDQSNGQREQIRPAKERPQQELPIMDPFLANNTQAVDRAKEGQNVLELQAGPNFWRFVLSQDGLDPLAVMLR
jgi:hypothetical protein